MKKYYVPNKATKAYVPVSMFQRIDPGRTPAKAYVKKDRTAKK